MNYWNILIVTNGNHFYLHENYSRLYTKVIVNFTFRYASNILVVGSENRDWVYVNHINPKKCSYFSGDHIEKTLIIYTTAILH